MTNHYWDSFNFSESNELLSDLMETLKEPFGEENNKSEVFQEKENIIFKEEQKTDYAVVSKREPKNKKNPLENVLIEMCRRGGFHGAVIADINGLPLAVYNSPVNGDILAAYTSVLGESLEKASEFINMSDANNISMDINVLDKIVLRRFYLSRISYYLMIIAPQTIDERSEIEILLTKIPQVLNV